MEESGDFTARKMLTWAFEAADGGRCRGSGVNGGGGGCAWKIRGWEDKGSMAPISENPQCWGVPVSTAAKDGVGIET